MPPGPIRSLRYIHEAIRAQTALIEERCAAAAQPADVAAFRDEITNLLKAVRGHAAGEDAGWFPALAARAPHSATSFQFDHDTEEERLAEIERLSARCESDADLRALYRAAVVVREQLHLHMSKEEAILWPLTEAQFTPPEQADIVQAILAAVPREDFPKLIPWIVERVTVDDAVAYVQLLERVQPPQAFAAAIGWLRDGVSPERLAALRPRVPALG